MKFKFAQFLAQASGTLVLLQRSDIAPHTQDHAIEALSDIAWALTGTGGGEPDFTALTQASDCYLVARKAGNPLVREQMEYLTALKSTITQLESLSYPETS